MKKRIIVRMVSVRMVGRMIRICVSDDFTVDYDEERAMYRVSVLGIDAKTMNECWNEIWFDAYKDEAVRHGKWLNEPPYTAGGKYLKGQECSICHSYFVSDGNKPYSNHPYCPQCGAKMDGE